MSYYGVPEQCESYDYTVDGSWTPREETVLEIADGIVVSIEYRDKTVMDIHTEGVDTDRALWTVVDWAREYGLPGVWKERCRHDGENYRLGGLYMIRGFELTERESDYAEYGERPHGAVQDE